ncbi:MAG: transglutaminase-like domain-containing protein [Deltaproteobacteria bacterium]|nr:transglutaminase-like domain-containing protein [Deltaproteobacteria bacterium]
MARMKNHWHRYAGGAAILLFGVLLIFRLGIPGNLLSGGGETVTPIQTGVPEGDAWMNITQGGRKIGYAQRTYARTEDGFRFSENIFMRINTMGIVQPLTVRTMAELKPDRTLLNFQFDLGSNLFKFTVRGTVAGKKLTVRIGGPGEEKLSVIALPEQPYLGGSILESVGAAGLKTGEGRTFPVFDPASLGQRPVRVTLLGEEPLTIMGKSLQARKLSVDFMGMKQIAWIDPEGSVLREEGILGIALERVTPEEALAGLEGAVSTDLTEIAAIPSSKPIADAASLKILKIRLEGLPEGSFSLDGGRQGYRNGVLTIRREFPSDPSVRAGAAAWELAAFLKPTPFIQSDHPKIRQKVAEIIAPGDMPDVKARKIVAWVYENLEKRPVLSVPNALETLENRIGDCNEHAVLLAALARAAGLPADVEAGVVYMRGRFFYHAWNVIYLQDRGGWVTADAVLGQMPADVTHIRFVRGEADRQLDLVGLIGRLKLDILEMER